MRLAALVALVPLCLVALGWTPDIGAPPAGTPGSPKPGVRTWSSGLFIDPGSREASRVLYRTVYASSEGVASGFTGDVEAGVAGDTTAAFQEATIKRINYYRAMAGVPADVQPDAQYAAKAQKAALIMAANQKLSHFPTKDWKYWSEEGAQGAGKSNLALRDLGPHAIDSYMLDPGATNAFVGHRRWVLTPSTRNMGSGDVEGKQGQFGANALYVVDASPGAFTTREPWIAWPPRGYVPYSLVFARWSFGLVGADFSTAVVTLTRDGVNVPLTVQSRNEGSGVPAIAFVPSGFSIEGWGTMPRPPSDVRFDVRIDGVLVGGKPQSYAYTLVAFDPAVSGGDAVQPAIGGPDKAGVGTNVGYSFTPVPRADDYHWQRARLGGGFQDGAEAGVGAFQPEIGAYDPTIGPGAQGTKAFRLAHPKCTSESLLLDRTFYVEAHSRLRFRSRRAFALAAQVSKVEVKVEGSAAWQSVWSDATAVSEPKGWVPVDVSLAAFAGYGVRIRFRYECSGSYFAGAVGGRGWAFDDVNVEASQIQDTQEYAVAPGSTSFWYPVEGGRTVLRVRPRFLGRYWLDWGPGKLVEGAGPPTAPIPPPATPMATPPVVTPTATPPVAPTATPPVATTPTTPPVASPTSPPPAPTSPWGWPLPTGWPAPSAGTAWPVPGAGSGPPPAWPGGFAWPFPVGAPSSAPTTKPPSKPPTPTPATPELPFPLPFPLPSALPVPTG